ncbi:UPF0182 family protein [Spirulina sp. CS-785/01]|uniref:UPF0182 family protein n=1 Tax=Spirulina sp. CS-785/01 TaxID=3021716 RepID=UPI00232D0DD0|nr:UPF0182 family protein [Spirulina sp. CS-785/01]MDB9311857.1 UPF0182 family protein [Spirulina sp. CS-785/01]
MPTVVVMKLFWTRLGQVAIALSLVLIIVKVTAYLLGEILWFQEVDYLAAFWVRLQSQVGLWMGVSLISLIFLGFNLRFNNRLKYPPPLESIERTRRGRNTEELSPRQRKKIEHHLTQYQNTPSRLPSQQNASTVAYPSLRDAILQQRDAQITAKTAVKRPRQSGLPLTLLLPLIVALGAVLGFMLLHYSKVMQDYWQRDLTLPKITPPLPLPFDWEAIQVEFAQITATGWGFHWQWLVVVGTILFLLVNCEWVLRFIAVGLSLLFGFVLSGNWTRILESFWGQPFNQQDPLYHLDISLYIFQLPVWELLYFWWEGLLLFALLAGMIIYLLSGDSMSQGQFPGFSGQQLRHLESLGGGLLLVFALHHGIEALQLVYSGRGVAYGASYTDVHIQLPVEVGLGLFSGAIALFLLYKAFFSLSLLSFIWQDQVTGKPHLLPFSLILVGLYAGIFLLGSFAATAVQRFSVQPNELEREIPYIERSIAQTRSGFALDRINAKTFNPQANLNFNSIVNNKFTIDNIRLWDAQPLLRANRQLQEIRLYYHFLDADIDRYTLQIRNEDTNQVQTKKEQVLISARELDYTKVPQAANTWVNEHLVYTHGYGFTLSPVNQVGEGGLPDYYVQDIASQEEGGTLRIAEEVVEDSIPIGKPRIYYGELTNNYIMTSTNVQELDFPSAQGNAQNTYDGEGGIAIGPLWRRLLFSLYLQDWRMLFTENFTPDTQLLFYRNINRRVREIAPFLYYDSDPYLVNVDLGESQYLYWIIDAYTTSSRYPYSDPGDHSFNYIRNSVKVVIDAYNGDVTFYIADSSDVIIQTWQKILPNFFKSLEEMPPALRQHIRYPTDFFTVQSEQLLTYHMTNPKVFYNREDQWEVPQEIYGESAQPVNPYHLIMRLPNEEEAEFILLHPYTPSARPNLIAWLAARSNGEQYGKLLLYQFPKQKLVYGVSQIEALINQDPNISQQISLWNTQGSRVLKGNLLIIPLEESLLYVEPLYLEAEQNSVPTLARVIVIYDNTIVMAENLDQAFKELFTPPSQREQSPPPIIRSLDGLDDSLLDNPNFNLGNEE